MPVARYDSFAPIYHCLQMYASDDAKINKSTKRFSARGLSFLEVFFVDLDSDDTEMSLNVPPIDGHSPYQLGSEQNYDLSQLTRQANREQIIDQNNMSILHPFSR